MKQLINIAILCLAIFATAYISFKSGCNDKLHNIESALQLQKDTLKVYKDKYGIEHAEKLAILANNNTIEQLYSEKLDSLKSVVKGLKTKHIVTYNETNATASNTFEVKTVRDTVRDTSFGLPYGWVGDCFRYDDSVLNLYGCMSDSNTIKGEYIANIRSKTLIYWSRKKILGLRIGKPQFKVNTFSDKPNVSISTDLSIVKKR